MCCNLFQVRLVFELYAVDYLQNWIKEQDGVTKWPSVYVYSLPRSKLLNHLAPELISKLESEYKLGKAYIYFSCDFVHERFYFDASPQLIISILMEKFWSEVISSYCTCLAGLQRGGVQPHCEHVIPDWICCGNLQRRVCLLFEG